MTKLSTNTDSGGPAPTTGPDAIDYAGFSHVHVEDDLLIYALDDEDGWLQSDLFFDLNELC